MKKLNKILSSVLAASIVVSCCAMNAFAASKAHTVTIKPAQTEGLKAGDTLVVELIMDNTESLVTCGYDLVYDASAFLADTTKVNRLEKCIDKTWLDGMKDTDGDWGYYLGNPTYNVATAGVMKFSWAGAEGVEAEYAMDNRVIGKFNLTVKDDVADGTYTFSLTGYTMDAGENSKADMVCTPVTVTVGEPAPVLAEPTVNVETKTNGTTQGFLATCTVDATIKPISGLKLALTDGTNNATKEYTFTKIEAGTAKYAVNVQNVPDGTTVTATGSAIVAE